MASTPAQSGSKRWTHFHSALQLAIQRSAHKWTWEDFTECFSLWCSEEPNGASAVFNSISHHMESDITNNCEALLEKFQVMPNLDRLHAVVTEARARKQAGNYEGKDVWRENLEPRAAVHARTVPLLEKERDRLKAQLAELDSKNLALQREMQANVRAREQADAETAALLDLLDEVSSKCGEVPIEDIQSWALQIAESTYTSLPP